MPDESRHPEPEELGRRDGGEAGGEPPAVLVVEDSMPLRRLVLRVLERHNLPTIEASHGQEALDAIELHGVERIGLILCDLLMPVMDGLQFVATARSLYKEELPPVVVITSRSDKEAVQTALAYGVRGYILKPFQTGEIIQKIREYCPELLPREFF
jgi:CheY-like chemotaxis protein